MNALLKMFIIKSCFYFTFHRTLSVINEDISSERMTTIKILENPNDIPEKMISDHQPTTTPVNTPIVSQRTAAKTTAAVEDGSQKRPPTDIFSTVSLLQNHMTHSPVNMVTPNENRSCTAPITKMVFIKSHKTGSTTMASIFQRYGYRHDLLFVLPKRSHIFSALNLFTREMVLPKPKMLTNRSFDILTNHAVYNRKEMDAVVPNAKYITIVRDPVYQFESAFGYFEWANKGMGLGQHPNPFEAFMMDPLYYYTTKNYRWKTASKNGQLYDFGIFPNSYKNMSEASLQAKIKQIDKEFDLVLLTEYFDESLILLKQLMCWEYDDIIYLSKGVRKDDHRYNISDEMKLKIRRWNAGDVLLYDHFNRTLWEKVAKYGLSFESDLAELRRLKQITTHKCVANDTVDTSDRRFYKLVSNQNQTDEYCNDLLRYDVAYTTLLKTKFLQYFR